MSSLWVSLFDILISLGISIVNSSLWVSIAHILISLGDSFRNHKDAFDSVQSLTTTIAIFIGGWWTLKTFSRKREKYPRANLHHTISTWNHPDGRRILHVVLTIRNDSEILLKIPRTGFTKVYQIVPWSNNLNDKEYLGMLFTEDGMEIDWDTIKEKQLNDPKEIEPKEEDTFTIDFLLDQRVEKVMVYSYIPNVSKPNQKIGWGISTIFSFDAATQLTEIHIDNMKPEQSAPDKRQGAQKPATRPLPPKPTTSQPQGRSLNQGAPKGSTRDIPSKK